MQEGSEVVKKLFKTGDGENCSVDRLLQRTGKVSCRTLLFSVMLEILPYIFILLYQYLPSVKALESCTLSSASIKFLHFTFLQCKSPFEDVAIQ